MGRHRGLRRTFDSGSIRNEADQHSKRMGELQEQGENFKEDKEKWEESYEEIESDSSMSRKEKIEILRNLRQEILETQEAYEERISEVQQEEIQKFQEKIEEMKELGQKFDEMADNLENLNSKTGVVDGVAATDEARTRAQEAHDWASTQAELLQNKIDHYNIQHNQMRNSRVIDR